MDILAYSTARAISQRIPHAYSVFSTGLDDKTEPFRSARWFLTQLVWHNSSELRLQGTTMKVVKAGKDHLDLVTQADGEFFELMELQRFPFDEQDLSVTLRCLCANEGSVAVKFEGLQTASLNLDSDNFMLWSKSSRVGPRRIWMNRHPTVRPGPIADSPAASFLLPHPHDTRTALSAPPPFCLLLFCFQTCGSCSHRSQRASRQWR